MFVGIRLPDKAFYRRPQAASANAIPIVPGRGSSQLPESCPLLIDGLVWPGIFNSYVLVYI